MSASRVPRVLIVEDEPMIVFMLEDLLSEAGFAIAGVASALAPALTLIESCDFDAALLDANLAGVSSAPAALALTARAIPFLVVSGYAEAQRHDAHSGGLYVSKPFNPASLIEAMWSILPDFAALPT